MITESVKKEKGVTELNNRVMKDWTLIKGLLMGSAGITVSELHLAEAWISLLIKIVSLVVVTISARIYWKKLKAQEKEVT